MSYIMVDIEADGPIPGEYSMVQIGAIVIRGDLDESFYGQLRPISENFVVEALNVSGLTREDTETFDDPMLVMQQFEEWVLEVTNNRPIFVSDNNGFDWMFVCWYFQKFLRRNPFGHSSQNLGSLYKGLVGDMSKNFKHLRKTRHTHNPIDDARGNAEAFMSLNKDYGLKVKLS
ncbi:MAG: exonuclease domain-containing protein [bacterium]|nr:exonuclease domain-containing protein [bacterium]